MTATRSAATLAVPPAVAPRFAHLRAFVAELAAHGLRHVGIAPGARSTPLTVSLAGEPRIDSWSHVDERSAAFFALGVARATRRPAAIVCTSGTAAANFYPAVVEAAHAGVPLIVLTADRPPELRDCEAGQAIDQIKMYGGYVKWFAEAGMADAGLPYFRSLARRALREAADVPRGVVHINFPLREPLIDDDAPRRGETAAGVDATLVTAGAPPPAAADVERLARRIDATPRGLILCGAADRGEDEAAAITALAARSGYPILADPTSQLRRAAHRHAVVASYDAIVADHELAETLAPDLVLRFGGMPVCKPLRLWLEHHAVPQIVFDPRSRWNDPSGTAAEMWRTDTSATCQALLATANAPAGGAWCAAWRAAEARACDAKAALLAATTALSGAGLFARLAATMPAGSCLYVGNSLPIRQLEAAWPGDAPPVRVLCNRGANGIDGVVSCILGAAAASAEPVVGVLGDLSFYHDLNGLLAARRRRIDATLIVLNNDGGGIFSMLPQARLGAVFDEYFTTPHGLDFEHAARLYDCAFDRIESWPHFAETLRRALTSPGTNIIEIPIDRDADVAITRELIVTAAKRAGGEE
jgi:2-succinyl-5-enolpyruvyl-6-hydroxy-3-cyclohexene-1-carboxylate synthase